VECSDPLGDGEAKAGASGLAGSRLVGSVKSLKDVWQVGGSDSDAIVADDDRGSFTCATVGVTSTSPSAGV